MLQQLHYREHSQNDGKSLLRPQNEFRDYFDYFFFLCVCNFIKKSMSNTTCPSWRFQFIKIVILSSFVGLISQLTHVIF